MTIFATLAYRFADIIDDLFGYAENGRNGW
jgi:hypothetical protein